MGIDMTDTKTVVLNLFKEARPFVEQDLDRAEIFKGFRDKARTHGVDWAQVKALLKATILDERDDGGNKRVTAIIDKADFVSAYADMLGLSSEKNISRSSSDDDLSIPPMLRRVS